MKPSVNEDTATPQPQSSSPLDEGDAKVGPSSWEGHGKETRPRAALQACGKHWDNACRRLSTHSPSSAAGLTKGIYKAASNTTRNKSQPYPQHCLNGSQLRLRKKKRRLTAFPPLSNACHWLPSIPERLRTPPEKQPKAGAKGRGSKRLERRAVHCGAEAESHRSVRAAILSASGPAAALGACSFSSSREAVEKVRTRRTAGWC
ncbi:uncharacterized protein LOC121107647 [Gallus gallus]|uniref:uncharacterized protein LOC121107647 n=1 Tax=Gallus gallus TaxID=9031 RepID=UPI001EFFF017|nr:uncharacterized protein LOC121107647 [Gallus gallus]